MRCEYTNFIQVFNQTETELQNHKETDSSDPIGRMQMSAIYAVMITYFSCHVERHMSRIHLL